MNKIKIQDYNISKEFFEIIFDEYWKCYKTTPIPKNINQYYTSENYISHTDSKKTLIDKIYQWVKKINIQYKINIIKKYYPSPTILDIGAGTGDFVKTCSKQNWVAYGIEPNENARNLAKKKGCNIYSDYSNLINEKYDVITLWHVLEHIPDIENELKKIKTLLKPNGMIIIAVPNFISWDAKYYSEFWAAWDVPRHLWHFSKYSINKCAEIINCKIINIKPMWFDAFYVSMLSEKYKFGKVNLLKVVFNGIRSNLYGIYNNEFSSHIFIMKNNKK